MTRGKERIAASDPKRRFLLEPANISLSTDDPSALGIGAEAAEVAAAGVLKVVAVDSKDGA